MLKFFLNTEKLNSRWINIIVQNFIEVFLQMSKCMSYIDSMDRWIVLGMRVIFLPPLVTFYDTVKISKFTYNFSYFEFAN